MNRRHFLALTGLAAAGPPALQPDSADAAQSSRWAPDGAPALGRVGVLTPEFDPVPESEMEALAPEGVSIHGSRVRRNATPAAFAEPPHVDEATAQLADLAPNAIAFAYTSSSYALGLDADAPTRARLEARARGTPVVLTCPAATDALHALGARRVALVHPPWFSEEVNDRGREYFRARGFDVVHCSRLEPARKFTEVRPDEVFEWVRSRTPRDAQAVFVGGNGLRAIGTIRALESSLGRPVLTANQVLFWAVLRTAQVSARITRYGRIFAIR